MSMKIALQSLQDRTVEWFSALVMLSWGGVMALPGDLLGEPSFVAFNRFGTTETFWAVLFCGVGTARLVALYINGRWPRSPAIRMVGSTFGAMSWGQVSYLLLQASWVNDTPISTGPAVYGLLALFDLYAVSRAAFDARYHHA